MEPRAASPCTEHTLRQGLLISALLLTIWNPLTTAQLTIESVPRHAVAGKKLLLRVHNLPDNIHGYFWYKEKILPRNVIGRFSLASNASIPGPAHTGREIIYHNGSLLIRNIIMNDTGVYILQTLNAMLENREASVKVQVYLKDIQEKRPGNPRLSRGVITGIVVGVVAGVALIGALEYFLYFRKTGGGSDQHSLTEHTPSSSNHSPGPDNAPKKMDEAAYSVLNINDQKLKQPTSAPVSPPTETIYS